MNSRSRPGRVSPALLDIVSATALLVAAGMFVVPVSKATHPIETRVRTQQLQRVSTTDAARDAQFAQIAPQIVSGNVFSATRRAPTVLFVPPGSESASSASVGAMPDPTTSITAVPDGDAPRLYGIVAQDGRRRALLQLPGADSVPRLLDVGDQRGRYRVVSISVDRVVLASSTGSRTVRLIARTAPDSLENLP